MMKQKDAAISTILNVLADRGVVYEMNGNVNMKDLLTSEDKTKIYDEMCAMYVRGEYEITTTPAGPALRKYVTGLISNWVTKYDGFNQGVKHTIKNPGSRAGAGNEAIKNLKILLEKVRGTANEATVQEAIDKAMFELKPTVTKEINVSLLPEHLRALA